MIDALFSIDEIRSIETRAKHDSPKPSLMERAGLSASNFALSLLPKSKDGAQILILAGPGDNGGDALEAAFHLGCSSAKLTICAAKNIHRSVDSNLALQRAQTTKAKFIDLDSITNFHEFIASTKWDLVIDGLFGIGLQRKIAGNFGMLITAINECPFLHNKILALDVPSGLNSDNGSIVGLDLSDPGVAIRSTHTITFIGDKPGMHTCNGRDYAGKVHIADLDIDKKYFSAPNIFLNNSSLFAHLLPRRSHNSHKGSFGNVVVIGGAKGMAGAPILSARASLQMGAGRVYLAFPDDAPSFDPTQPELMCRSAHDFDFSSNTLVIGPGLGASRTACDLLSRALHTSVPIVIDADALNLIAAEPGVRQHVMAHRGGVILTPHPLEAARLLNISAMEVQADRINVARQLAQEFNAVVILKGSGTIITGPGEPIVVNPTGNPGLATAGTGDVLAGVCGALLAQGMPTWDAALAAVWIHGKAADILVEQGIGPIGMTASELLPAARSVLNRLTLDQLTATYVD